MIGGNPNFARLSAARPRTMPMTIAIAVVGLATSLILRAPPASDPNLKFRWGTLAIPREMIDLCRRDREGSGQCA